MARAAPPESPAPGAPGWIVTFADLTSLLVAFFALLFTFSSTDSESFAQARGSLSGGLGVASKDRRQSHPNVHATEQTAKADTSLWGQENVPGRSDEEVDDDLAKKVQDASFDQVLAVNRLRDGVRVVFMGPDLFLPGGRPSAKMRDRVGEVARLVATQSVRIVVESSPKRTSEDPEGMDRAAWGRRMGFELYDTLVAAGIPSTRIGVAPLPTEFPGLPDDRPHVALRILSERAP